MTSKETPELLSILRTLWSFNASSGTFTWKPRPDVDIKDRRWNGKFSGRQVGCQTSQGYIRTTVKINGKNVGLLLHRVVWAFATGQWPTGLIDHKNEVKSDNRVDNLRIATHAQNISNRVQKNDSAGIKGVKFDSRYNRYQARITVDGKTLHLGMFDTAQEAGLAYKEAAIEHYGEFAKTNIGDSR